MCINCADLENKAARILGRDVEDVRTVHAAIKAAMVEQTEEAEQIREAMISQLPPEIQESIREVDMDDDAPIPSFALEGLRERVGGPVIIIGISPIEGDQHTLTLRSIGTGDRPETIEKILSTMLDTVRSPVVENGGVGPDGQIVMRL